MAQRTGIAVDVDDQPAFGVNRLAQPPQDAQPRGRLHVQQKAKRHNEIVISCEQIRLRQHIAHLEFRPPALGPGQRDHVFRNVNALRRIHQ